MVGYDGPTFFADSTAYTVFICFFTADGAAHMVLQPVSITADGGTYVVVQSVSLTVNDTAYMLVYSDFLPADGGLRNHLISFRAPDPHLCDGGAYVIIPPVYEL